MSEKTVIIKEWKKFRRYKDGAEYYGMSLSMFQRMAKEAKALYKRSKAVWVNCEIFEKYYPNQAEMVVDFWMPNKEWEGCNVNDPSARILSNYGESGM